MGLTVITLFSVFIVFLAFYWPCLWSFGLLCLLTATSIALGISAAVKAHLFLSPPHQTSPDLIDKVEKELTEMREKLMLNPDLNFRRLSKDHRLPIVFGRTVDSLFQQLLDLILKDFVLIWLKDYASKPEKTVEAFKEDVWGAVQDLHDRLSRIDVDRLLACDMVTKITLHFEKIRVARTLAAENRRSPVFFLYPHLLSSEAELNYLRQISELLIMFLLPRGYSLAPAAHLLKEVITCKILQPAINMITEPDYLNQKILIYLEAQKAAAAMNMRTHEYARSFEEFLKLIQNCNEMDTLKKIRYNIVSEIMQATTLQNVKRAKGIDVDALEKSGMSGVQGGVSRQQVVAARKLKRYISQLSYAKSQCESALLRLGWDGGFPSHDSDARKVLPLVEVLESVTGRRHLSLFLETLCSQGLVGFWVAVEELRTSHRSNWHQLGAEIFYTYIRSPSAEIKVDKETRKRMEAFLLGDKGPEVFYEVQQSVVNTLHDKYYPTFVLSSHYQALLKALATEEARNEQVTIDHSPIEDRQLSGDSVSSSESVIGALHVGEHSTYARRKLDQLQEKLNNKTQALAALKASLKPESRALELLAREVERLAGERRRLEAHLARTDTWAEHLGKWRATVNSAEIIDESSPPQFVIVVHMAEHSEDSGTEVCENISTGWVLLRTLTEFQELHRKLRPMCSDVKNLDLPSNSFKFLFGKSDKNTLEKAKCQIQKYLEFVLEDDRLNQSEALYAFLSPSSEHLKHTAPLPKKSRFSFSTLFKSNDTIIRSSHDKSESIMRDSGEDEDISLYLDGESGDLTIKNTLGSTKTILGLQSNSSEDGKDAIAEPLYGLMGEVFDMRGVFKWLRKTLITFVQITYGRTINRQIRDTIAWIFSEQMLHYYISLIMKSWWPGGILLKQPPERTQQEKDETRLLAKQSFINNIPDVLTNLVGAQSAHRGAQKIFDTLQNHTINKQLFYDLLDLLLMEAFPELKQHI